MINPITDIIESLESQGLTTEEAYTLVGEEEPEEIDYRVALEPEEDEEVIYFK